MAGTKVNFPDEDGWTWRTVDDLDMEEMAADMFRDGLRVVDYQRVETKYDNSSVVWNNYALTKIDYFWFLINLLKREI